MKKSGFLYQLWKILCDIEEEDKSKLVVKKHRHRWSPWKKYGGVRIWWCSCLLPGCYADQYRITKPIGERKKWK